MAYKSDLLNVPPRTDRKIKYQPWYRERLELKYLRNDKKAASYNTRRWVFVRNDMDDMRKGKLKQIRGEDMVVKGREDAVPIVDSAADVLNKKGSRSTPHHIEKIIKHSNGKSSTLYTKVGPRRQKRAEQLRTFIGNLQAHPLAMYPHYGEAIPPELFDEIVSQVDPVLKLTRSETEFSEDSELGTVLEEQEEQDAESTTEVNLEQQQEEPSKTGIYRLPLKKSDKEVEEEEEAERTRKKVVSASQENRVKDVTRDLCQWMSDLNSEDSSGCLDEGTIKNLFTSDPESMVDALPFQVIEMGNIPVRLREAFQGRGSSAGSAAGAYALVDTPRSQQHRLVKTRYGAWYLPPKTWKLTQVDKPLRDPKVIAQELERARAKEEVSLDHTLANLHGAKAFKTFILSEKTGVNMPYFLNEVQPSATKQNSS